MVFTPDISVAIILVNWNGYEFTRACLDSLRKLNFPDFKVILVDNASDNQEGKNLKKAFPEIDLLENDQNLGFAGGNNVGIRHALTLGYSHILLLNNDTEVEPDFLEEMVFKLRQNPKIAVVQPLILFLHNKKEIWSAGGKWNANLSKAVTLGDREPLADYRIGKSCLDWATGCCMLISREAILDCGLLNEQYFVYFEDVEWSLRFTQKGYQIALADKAVIYHEAGASSKKKNEEGALSPKVFYFNVRNQFFLIRAAGGPFIGKVYHLGKFTLWMGYFLLRGRFNKLKAVAKGIRDGFFTPLAPPVRWP